MPRSKRHKKDSQVISVIFAILESALVKAGRRMLMKLTSDGGRQHMYNQVLERKVKFDFSHDQVVEILLNRLPHATLLALQLVLSRKGNLDIYDKKYIFF